MARRERMGERIQTEIALSPARSAANNPSQSFNRSLMASPADLSATITANRQHCTSGDAEKAKLTQYSHRI